MESNLVIEANNISKKFCRKIRHVMLYGSIDIIKDFFGIKSKSHNLRNGEFWAVKDVSLELEKGKTLGIIGLNGSGKSTILKMLNGIFMPDDGSIKIKGRAGALIEVGAGFHPMLTGRENIYINGSILGMGKKEIDRKFNDIVDFSELREFIDTPVKFYSSGMYVRLGFSIAIFCDPDILLLDEILSVGDISFQNKAFKRLYDIKNKISGVVYVGHNMQHVRNMCDSVIVINKGSCLFKGDTSKGISFYQNFVDNMKLKKMDSKEEKNFLRMDFSNYSNDTVEIINFGLMDENYNVCDTFKENNPIIQYCDFEIKKEVKEIEITFGITDEFYRVKFFHCSNIESSFPIKDLKPGKYRILLKFIDTHLASGLYISIISIRNVETGEVYHKVISKSPFSITGNFHDRGYIRAENNWDLKVIY
ncbi:MAG: ATP-binding cassette domain-containing protein [Actinobacteria bacterium]|nr:ATP-binding cassette domain-containing protein [Chloroflexota bacterium]MBE3129039.1 ATP-binding cassette domain-containing protein [Actinomycetota bacterium]